MNAIVYTIQRSIVVENHVISYTSIFRPGTHAEILILAGHIAADDQIAAVGSPDPSEYIVDKQIIVNNYCPEE